jgi:short-subunit dehydrogenase
VSFGVHQDPDWADLRQRYGPWAVIAGASEGIGSEYARLLAAAEVNCVLVSRRRDALDELAAELVDHHGVEGRVIALDLSEGDAAQRLFDQTADLEVGLYISNAGADTRASLFLDCPVDEWLTMMRRNTTTVVGCCHRFATAMKQRGSGGILIMASGAGLGGGSRIAVYSATKAFEIAFAESLWSELTPQGIDVTCLVAPGTDTPALRRLLDQTGMKPEGLYTPELVARTGLRELGRGPTYVFPFGELTAEMAAETARTRRERVEMMTRASSALFYGEGG